MQNHNMRYITPNTSKTCLKDMQETVNHGHLWATSSLIFSFYHVLFALRSYMLIAYNNYMNPMDSELWQATAHRVAAVGYDWNDLAIVT